MREAVEMIEMLREGESDDEFGSIDQRVSNDLYSSMLWDDDDSLNRWVIRIFSHFFLGIIWTCIKVPWWLYRREERRACDGLFFFLLLVQIIKKNVWAVYGPTNMYIVCICISPSLSALVLHHNLDFYSIIICFSACSFVLAISICGVIFLSLKR